MTNRPRPADFPHAHTIRLPEGLHESLEHHAAISERSVSSIIRECIQRELPRLQRRLHTAKYRVRLQKRPG